MPVFIRAERHVRSAGSWGRRPIHQAALPRRRAADGGGRVTHLAKCHAGYECASRRRQGLGAVTNTPGPMRCLPASLGARNSMQCRCHDQLVMVCSVFILRMRGLISQCNTQVPGTRTSFFRSSRGLPPRLQRDIQHQACAGLRDAVGQVQQQRSRCASAAVVAHDVLVYCNPCAPSGLG